jgi:hypothetical protein
MHCTPDQCADRSGDERCQRLAFVHLNRGIKQKPVTAGKLLDERDQSDGTAARLAHKSHGFDE